MHRYDVSVILPFRDSEETIGTAVARLARYLRDRELSFEILAVDDDSRDNSQALLALIRPQQQELRVIHSPARRRGYETGTRRAQGRVLWFIEPEAAIGSLDWFGPAHERIATGEQDMVVCDFRSALAHRTRCLPVLAAIRWPSSRPFVQRLAKRAAQRHLLVDAPGPVQVPRSAPGWASALLAALPLTRTS